MVSMNQKILFVLGKGGVGRTTISATLGYHYSSLGLKTLIVQWTVKDTISPLFFKEQVGHKHKEIIPNLFVMNYDPEITLKEYFVDHLHMSIFYKFILENPHVKKLLQATPGLEEIFFLGRIFWLAELAKEERGYDFDKIIVDAPATGHGSAMFGVVSSISNFKLEGPLISEVTRVAKLMEDSTKVASVVATLPEELPFEETLELIQFLEKEMKRPPKLLFINRSLSFFLRGDFQKYFYEEDNEYKKKFPSIYLDIINKLSYEKKIKDFFNNRIPVIALPDVIVQDPSFNSLEKIQTLARFLKNYEY
ncbi:MAG: ArsA family ATPase [Leptonema sp. (in: bacteria)]